MFRAACCIAFLTAGLSAAAQAAVVTYTNRSAWEAAVAGAPLLLEDFNSFTVDTSFQDDPVVAGPLTLVEVGGSNFRNNIDAPPSFTPPWATARPSPTCSSITARPSS